VKKFLIPIGLILILGLIEILSISFSLFKFQLIWIFLGIIILILISKINWVGFFNYPWIVWSFYFFIILLLAVTLFFGPVIRGTKGWIVLGGLRFQPVELAKVALILIYASYFSRKHILVASWKTVLESFILFAIPGSLVALQPDLGSLLILFGIWFGFLIISGLPPKKIIATFIIFIILGLIGWQYFLKDYQKQRILGVFFPEKNALTINYSVIQSKIAISAGGFWGKGFRGGTQTQLGFLTEPATDFIFAALIEEWGLIAGFVVIFAFLIFIINLLKLGARANLNIFKFICLGIATVFIIHFFINTGSVLGIFPVVGVSFPFLSYGGSNLLINFIFLGMISYIFKNNE
jgi:rod shape determining protein RodA